MIEVSRSHGRIRYKADKKTTFTQPDRITKAGVFGDLADSEIVNSICQQPYTETGATVIEALAYLNKYRAPSPQADTMWAILRAAREEYTAIKAGKDEQARLEKIENGGFRAVRHANFSGYLDDINGIFRASRSAYTKIQNDFSLAKETWKAQSADFGMSSTGRLIAEAEFAKAEQTFNDDLDSLRHETTENINKVRAEMQAHLTEFYTATPDKLDMKALELMKSGIMTDAEYESMANSYRGNPAMLRVIGSYAKEREGTRGLAYKLRGMTDGASETEVFDTLCMYADKSLQTQRGPADRFAKEWDGAYSSAKSTMQSFFAAPQEAE